MSEYIDTCTHAAIWRVHLGHNTSITGAFKLVQAGPVSRQVRRLENVNIYQRGRRVKGQSRKSERTPRTGIRKPAPHGASTPAPVQASQLVVIDATRCQRSITGKTRFCGA